MSVNKLYKLLDLIKTKYYMKFKQKTFKGEKYNINYLLEENPNSDILIVVFTACTKVGQKARYNYVRTVENYNYNKLFILDDFGFDNRGAYYLGKNKDFKIQEDVSSLISLISSKLNINKEIFIGSSKGGYAAFYFGIDRKNSTIIAGAPQYNLGDYLNLPGHKEILKYIMGDINEDSIKYLNTLLEDKLYNSISNNNEIYLHYSDKEETFDTDLKFLVNKLNSLNYNCIYDKHDYKEHANLTLFFPQFIKDVLNKYK
ncbi:hypothetical protein JCM1393_09530 [Clostridium carnis]